MNYQIYIESEEWKAKRDDAVRSAGHRCQICNRKGILNAHHRTYKNLGNEQPGDLTVLCRRCHQKHHLPPPPAPVFEPRNDQPPTRNPDPVGVRRAESAIVALLETFPTLYEEREAEIRSMVGEGYDRSAVTRMGARWADELWCPDDPEGTMDSIIRVIWPRHKRAA